MALGTHEQPFLRALALVEPLAEREEILVQHGHTPPPAWCRASRRFDFLSYERLVELIRAADAVVCHAGVGTIMTVLALAKTPVVLPRLARFGEHVDDHQLQIAGAFSERGLIEVVEGGDLAASVTRARRAKSRHLGAAPELRKAVFEATSLA